MGKFWRSKQTAFGEAFVLLAVGGLAAYLKPAIGVPVLLALLVLGVWLIWRSYRQPLLDTQSRPNLELQEIRKKDNGKEATISNKTKGQQIHTKILELDTLLEKTKSGLAKEENWLANPEIRDTLDKLQVELNTLGYLIKRNDYDRWAEEMMKMHSWELTFHIKDSDINKSQWGNARVNAKLRWFINKIKG